MIILLFTSVVATHIYNVFQSPTTLQFQLEYEDGSITLDLNSDITKLQQNGNDVKCNSAPFGQIIQCTGCTPTCMIGDGYLQTTDIQIRDVLDEKQIEPMLYVYAEESEVLGLGQNRGSKYPQNPFVSNIFHICIGFTKGFVTREFKNPYSNSLTYKNSSKYQVDLQFIKIDNETIINSTGILTYVDSIQPYILLPDKQFKEIKQYFEQFGVIEEQNTLVLKDNSIVLPKLELYFAEDEKIIMENDTYIYTLENKSQILTFYKSKINRIELGLPFLTQKLITINQETKKLYFSKFNCQGEFEQIQRYPNYYTQIILPFSLICIVFYCILTQKAKNDQKYKQLHQSELARLQREEEEI